MVKRLALALLAVAALAGAARAQEVEEDEPRPEPVRRIKVLEHPYDIASFYRSSQGEYFGLSQSQGSLESRYPIASFYRSRQSGMNGYGYAPFWNHGYGYQRRGVGAVGGLGYRRRIGENGDLFLFVPFLAPVGPLNGAFFN
jgi:hypothetical protein